MWLSLLSFVGGVVGVSDFVCGGFVVFALLLLVGCCMIFLLVSCVVAVYWCVPGLGLG